MSSLQMQGVAKRFGSIEALRDVNLEVQSGEFFALLGPSAAGKTTTLRTIAGLETSDAGTVTFAGKDVTHSPVQGRDIAMIFQSFALYPHLTIRDNLAYPLKEARLDAAIQEKICVRVSDACKAYDLREGPIHAELRINQEDIWIIEIAARTIGGQCARLLQFGAGKSLEELVLGQILFGFPTTFIY